MDDQDELRRLRAAHARLRAALTAIAAPQTCLPTELDTAGRSVPTSGLVTVSFLRGLAYAALYKDERERSWTDEKPVQCA